MTHTCILLPHPQFQLQIVSIPSIHHTSTTLSTSPHSSKPTLLGPILPRILLNLTLRFILAGRPSLRPSPHPPAFHPRSFSSSPPYTFPFTACSSLTITYQLRILPRGRPAGHHCNSFDTRKGWHCQCESPKIQHVLSRDASMSWIFLMPKSPPLFIASLSQA
ncbi:hypothetical protein HYFRA_00005329 [Hymenoscyphus fraxineus]|uniref:Uncharacterized protein n=1 Tax=Hymenoscyphus fraxineus TaxID=746836 RepID=A0A9N9LAW8_9HELO|nr:hypothetical protein HYFRA_00005329 [Hymenoscyphus fraxineus]